MYKESRFFHYFSLFNLPVNVTVDNFIFMWHIQYFIKCYCFLKYTTYTKHKLGQWHFIWWLLSLFIMTVYLWCQKNICIYSTPHAKHIILVFLLMDTWQTLLWLMEGTENYKYKGTMSVWNYILAVQLHPSSFRLRKFFQLLVFVTQNVHTSSAQA